jgi:hypothetical protein
VNKEGNQNIKACPFPGCGAKCEVIGSSTQGWVECLGPGCGYGSGICGSKAKAIAAHNRVAACVEACQGIPTEALEAGVLEQIQTYWRESPHDEIGPMIAMLQRMKTRTEAPTHES